MKRRLINVVQTKLAGENSRFIFQPQEERLQGSTTLDLVRWSINLTGLAPNHIRLRIEGSDADSASTYVNGATGRLRETGTHVMLFPDQDQGGFQRQQIIHVPPGATTNLRDMAFTLERWNNVNGHYEQFIDYTEVVLVFEAIHYFMSDAPRQVSGQ